MPDSIDTYAAKTHLSQLLARAEAGEEIVITRRGTPVAKLVPVAPKPPVIFGLLKGKVWISDDFNDEDPALNALFHNGEIEPPA